MEKTIRVVDHLGDVREASPDKERKSKEVPGQKMIATFPSQKLLIPNSI
jgi:hypothetical protein